MTTSSEARELSLILKVELRIALVDSDEKLQSLLQTYLAPLLLKLASDSLAVRNKVIAVCQHVNNRIQSQSIQLPVSTLLKQFKEQKSQLIRHYDLLYIQQGIDRVDPATRVDHLPTLLQGISDLETTTEQGASHFSLILRLLPLLKLHPNSSPEDVGLKDKLGLSAQDTQFMSLWFGKLLLLWPADKDSTTCPGLSPSEYKFLNKEASVDTTWDPTASGGLNLTETKITVLRFLGSGAFTDLERFIPALIASADSNSRVSAIGNDVVKRLSPDHEDPIVIEQLYMLYFGIDPTPPARPPLQIKILIFLGKSVKATTYTDRIIQLLDSRLFTETVEITHGLQASKLRSQIFTFTTWLVRMGSGPDLRKIAPKAITGLKTFISTQGWPDPAASGRKLTPTDLSLRGHAYESIGTLASKVDLNTHGDDEGDLDIKILRWLFKSLSLDASSLDISVSIEQALGSILNSFADNYNGDTKWLESLLLYHMKIRPGESDPTTKLKVVRSTQFAAVRFANRCLPYKNLAARFIDILAVGSGPSGQREILEEGKKGLHPHWYRMLNPVKDKERTDPASREIETNNRYAFPLFRDLIFTWGMLPEFLGLERALDPFFPLFMAAISFVRYIFLWEAFSTSQIPIAIDEGWEDHLDTLISSNGAARSAMKKYIQENNLNPVRLFLNNALDGLLLNKGDDSGQCGAYFIDICSLASNEALTTLVEHTLLLKKCISSNSHVTQRQAAKAIGILASHISFPENECRDMLSELTQGIAAWKIVFGPGANEARGSLLTVAYLLSRLAYRRRLVVVPEILINEYMTVLLNLVIEARDYSIQEAAQVALGQFSLCGILNPEILSSISIWQSLKNKLREDSMEGNETSITTLGRLSLIMSVQGDSDFMFGETIQALYDLHEIRKPEVQFAVGSSLSTAAAGWNSNSLVGEFDVDEVQSENSDRDGAIRLTSMADKIIGFCGASKPSLRKASAIWLLCLIKDCGHTKEIQERLRKCQAAFTGLLTDRDQVVQESGSRGLSLVYENGDQDIKDDLVRDLVRYFTGNNANLGGGQISEDTELFDPGALPTGERSSVTTYKDIMSLASEVGDPSLVYRFMSLASNNAIWSSRAAFGRFGLSSLLSNSSIDGYLAKNPKFYPKLYRYRFDPSPNVQRSMNDIWQALVKDPSSVIDAHFDEIMEDLLDNILSGKEWRVRQASCAALVDLVQGRRLEKYDKYMSQILTKAFKVLDDIKDSVRAAALRLCQVIMNTVIQSLETGNSDSKRATALLAHSIPFLLGQGGIESSVQEVQAYAIKTLIQIIKKSPGTLLRPFVPRILETLLSCLSSLEPQAVNYIHLNADKYGLTGQEIDKMRLSSIRMSPILEVIERYLLDGLDEGNIQEVAEKLEGVLRSAVGLPSKVGCSRVLAILSTKPVVFRPYADRFIQQLTKYVLDRNETVSASYSTSIGYLVRLATDDRVLKTIEFTKQLYLKAEDSSHRSIAGEILHSASKLASDRFTAFAAAALPFVFVAKHDLDDRVRETFEKTWQENVGGSRAVSLYLKEILSLVSNHLDSPRWDIKHSAALATADVITCLDRENCASSATIIWPVLERALSGSTWSGKEKVLQAFVKFTSSVPASVTGFGVQMRTIVVREAKRNNPAYRPHALRALGDFAVAQDDLDLMPDVLSIVPLVVEEYTTSSGDKMEIDSGDTLRRGSEETLAACVSCLLRCPNPLPRTIIALNEYLVAILPIVEEALQGSKRSVQAALYDGLLVLFNRIKIQLSGLDPLHLSELEASLTDLVNRLLLRDMDLTIEANRAKRARAAEGYILLCHQLGFSLIEALRQSIVAWLAQERSEPVRRTLSEVSQKL
jgi:proteasome component ECM29